ncbi:peptidoglycan recognition protein family protein [Paludisphaera mucosa]|uniref:Peptidoglycan recognition family protein n=1 Tax=Paludisphaera mucosa TaxID=3030827 RepID=A0ABT6FFH3_9BACT|nr:peptidoglycan recognition family protein [Paludisphaera mucosa]MDG3006318.1 peptidoglycan recognition family protein [Paludisphaera mucosa]
MANVFSAPIALRAQRACLAAAAVGALLAAGCNHRRSVLRPVMPAPRVMAAPGCTNCGSGGSSVVTSPGTAIIREGPAGGSAREPVIITPGGGLDSSVPLESPPSSVGSSPTSRRAPAAETPPKATIDEPLLDDLSPAAATSSRSRSLRPPIESKPKSSAPDLSAPAPAAGATSMSPGGSGSLRTTSATGVVRRASAKDPLRTYFATDAADDLFFPNKADRPWKYVVVHHSATEAGSYDAIDAEHRKLLGLDGCGYHFVIGNGTGSGDGQIEVSQRWVNQKHGVHCRNARRADIDEYGIGVCLIGDFEKAPPTPRQQAALKALLAYLSERYTIEQDRLETHSHMAATPTVCPGKHFPTNALEVPARPAAAQADASPTPSAATRRHVPTAWRLPDLDPAPTPAAPAR